MPFDLLKLHDNNIDLDMKGSWIKAKGTNLNQTMKEFLRFMCSKHKQNKIARLLSSILNCSFSTAKRHLIKINKGNSWIALKIISLLLKLWKNIIISRKILPAERQKKWLNYCAIIPQKKL